MLMKALWRHQRLPGCSENSYTGLRIYGSPLPPPPSLPHHPLKFKEGERGERKRKAERRENGGNHPNFDIKACFHFGM